MYSVKGCCLLAVFTETSLVNPLLICDLLCLANCLILKMVGKHWSCHLSNQSAYFYFDWCLFTLTMTDVSARFADCSEYAQQLCVDGDNLIATLHISNKADVEPYSKSERDFRQIRRIFCKIWQKMAKCMPSKNINTFMCQHFRYMGNRAGKTVTDLHILVFKVLTKYHVFHRNCFPFKLDNQKCGTVEFNRYI